MKASAKQSNDTVINQQLQVECQMMEQVFVVLLAQDIINKQQKQMNRIDLTKICSLMLEQQNIQMPRFKIFQKYISVDPIRSLGQTKGILVAEVDQRLYQFLLSNPIQRKIIKDIDNDIIRQINFSFTDLKKTQQTSIFQNGKFEKEYIQVIPQLSTFDRTMFKCLHRVDSQIYAINKMKLSQQPKWEDLYFPQLDKIDQVKCLQKLNHPNVIRQYSWWLEYEVEAGGIYNYYIYQQQEYFYQNDLLSFIFKQINHLKENDKKPYIAIIFKQLITGLQYINQQGIFHRNIKPENILVCKDQNGDLVIKISGFEMAKCNIDSDGNKLSSSYQTQLTGTEGYIGLKSHPNQFYDATEEMYQCGMVLLDLCHSYERVADRNYYHFRVQSGNPPSDFQQMYQIEFDLVRRLLNREFSDFYSLINSREYQNLINQK